MPKFDPDKEYRDYTVITDANAETIYEAFYYLGEQIENKYHIPPEYYSRIKWYVVPPTDANKTKVHVFSQLGFVSWTLLL